MLRTAAMALLTLSGLWYLAFAGWIYLGGHQHEPATQPWITINAVGILGLMIVGGVLWIIWVIREIR